MVPSPRIRPPKSEPSMRRVNRCFIAAVVLSPVTITVVTDVDIPGQSTALYTM